ncbi:MAG: YiiD C-terminal domain-containing protein [Deltaproteobacteria bacterium]|nr:YiiD C-terminal domain-containing protein [Deltaproteobacteria bacterium]
MQNPAPQISPQFKQMLVKTIPFVERAGMTVEEMEPRRAVGKMPIKLNLNHVQIMYAGSLFTLAEITGGAMLAATFDLSKYRLVVKSFNIEFKKPVKTDALCEIAFPEEEVERIKKILDTEGRSDFTVKGVIRDMNGVEAAFSTAVYNAKKI